MTPVTPVLIICARAPGGVPVPAEWFISGSIHGSGEKEWRCSWCGARVKVVA